MSFVTEYTEIIIISPIITDTFRYFWLSLVKIKTDLSLFYTQKLSFS